MPPEEEHGEKGICRSSGEEEISLSFNQLPKAKCGLVCWSKIDGCSRHKGNLHSLTSFPHKLPHWMFLRKMKGRQETEKGLLHAGMQKVTSGCVWTGP